MFCLLKLCYIIYLYFSAFIPLDRYNTSYLLPTLKITYRSIYIFLIAMHNNMYVCMHMCMDIMNHYVNYNWLDNQYDQWLAHDILLYNNISKFIWIKSLPPVNHITLIT